MTQIKIVTINTWKCDGDYRARMELLAEQLQVLKPDIIACQECFHSGEGKADTLKFLAERLNMHFSFLPGRQKKRRFEEKWVDSLSGLGVLSAYRICSVKGFNLPIVPGDEDRKALQVQIQLPSGNNLCLTNTHLTHLGTTSAPRKKQAKELADIARTNTNCPYNLVCGDFNAVIGSDEINAFISGAKAVDCYTKGNGAEPRYSVTGAYEGNKFVCIDHIFALPFPGENAYPDFINSGVVLNVIDPDTGLYPSDHFGISTMLVIS